MQRKKQTLMIMIVAVLAVCAIFVGCQRGDIQAEFVIDGQPAPFDGYTLTPSIYALRGQPVVGTGLHVHVEGADPNDILGSNLE
jgi:hypothetical protein